MVSLNTGKRDDSQTGQLPDESLLMWDLSLRVNIGPIFLANILARSVTNILMCK